jgi:glutathione peroxidase
MKYTMARMAMLLARPAAVLIRKLRGTSRVSPLSASFYALTLPDLDGAPVDLARFAGRVSLVVNVACECGFTPQYAGLQALHERYAPEGFTVLGLPSNEFGGQEPGSPRDIRAFCDREYGITFPILAKGHTRPGPDQSAAWQRLGESGHLPAWNFYKFLVGRDGQVAAVFPTSVAPESREVKEAIERALRAGGASHPSPVPTFKAGSAKTF